MEHENASSSLVRDLVECSVQMERIVSKIYAKLASRLSSLEALAARHIARESNNHALFLEELLQALDVERNKDIDCSKIVGNIFNKIENILKNIDKMSVEEAKKSLGEIESELGEETYHCLMLPLLKDVIDENVDLINVIVDEIIEEEKFHHILVEKLSEVKASSTNQLISTNLVKKEH